MSSYTLCCQVGLRGAATDTRAQMVRQETCRKPLSAWVSHREGLPSLPARRDTHSTGHSGGGSRAMCHRLACTSQWHSHLHININRNAYAGMCTHQQAPSHLHIALKAKCINAFFFLKADIFIIQLSNERLKHEYWHHAWCRQTTCRTVHRCGNLPFFFCPWGHEKWVKRPWKCSKHRCALWPVLKGCTEP